MRYRSKKSCSGLSLIEVLAAVAIIGLLAAILFPLLSRMRGQSKKTQCASNLKQLGNAFTLYVSDWNGFYPAPGGLRGDYGYWSQTGRGGLVGYIGRNGGIGTVWCCPEQATWRGAYPARTYSMNSYLRDSANGLDPEYPGCIGILRGIAENTIEVKGKTILLYEGMPIISSWMDDMDNYIYRCGNWKFVRGYYPKQNPCNHTENSWLPWHGDRNNYLYCDGHIRSYKPIKDPNHPPYDATNEWWVRKSAMAARYRGW